MTELFAGGFPLGAGMTELFAGGFPLGGGNDGFLRTGVTDFARGCGGPLVLQAEFGFEAGDGSGDAVD